MNSTSWLWAPGAKAPVEAGKIPSPMRSTATVTPARLAWTERAVTRAWSNGMPSRLAARRAAPTADACPAIAASTASRSAETAAWGWPRMTTWAAPPLRRVAS